MLLKMTNLKSIIKSLGLLLLIISGGNIQAQEVIVTDSTSIGIEAEIQEKINDRSGRFKVDGVAAVIGDFVVLESDIDKMYLELQSQGVSTEDVTNCNLAGRLMENKLYAHHAIQDSILVSDAEINANIDQQLAYMTQQVGSLEKVLEFYKKDSEAEFRAELFEINKQNRLASEMQRKIVDAVEITPEEVRAFFTDIPEDELPVFGDEVEISQIVVEPEIPQEEITEILNRLNKMRADVVENGASFATKAVLYSQDPGSRSSGGKISLTRKDPFVKEFKDAAFSMQEGEVSKPFQTEFGYHILTVDKIRGQQVDVRHILLIPDVTEETKQEAFDKIDNVRERIINDEISFADAAKEVSDEKETRESGGKLVNPTTGDTRFELTKIDPLLYEKVVNLKEGEVSTILTDQDNTGRPFYKIITVTNRYSEHKANYAQDYNKIKELALRDKQLEAIEKWQKEKIEETYVKVNGEYRNCEFSSNWLKN
ncbi:peptidylprolyl isomerase [Salinimicrobium sediminilitoris]|uniref:peptidylprolyl isomerase n=1 Tax=Salinimicrobium sediminilitoris TaxID=2876715 RepID=UPI001E4B25DC|nr:peptidylprolyl isomerase [Salinimicrobium sediminilitoris]MCC8358589.1 peptidylprolyl isomerase [Salinimicrobium sediminilitoris]